MTSQTRLVVCILLLPALLAGAPPRHRHSRHGSARHKRVASAQEARVASVKKAQLRHKLHGLHGHIHDVRAKIHQAKAKEGRITETIGTVEARIGRTQHNIARVNARLHALDVRHDAVTQHLQTTQQQLALRRRLLAERLRDNYTRSQATYSDVLIQSRSVHELLSRGYYVRRIVESDTELIKGVRQDIAQINADKRQLEAQAQEQKSLAAEFEAQKTQYAADLERKQELLQNVQATRAQAQDELDELEGESEAMTDRIRTLSEMLRRRREAQRQMRIVRRHRPHRAEQGGDENGSGDGGGNDEAPVWNGGFLKPCDGYVISGFGYRYHPILHRRRMHTGVDFAIGYGSPIRAAGSGTVILAQYNGGYGNCVIIDHGNGVTTLYGHASALLVSEGQNVTAGQVIARVGATGLATGPHLHFEVRHNGVPVRPPF